MLMTPQRRDGTWQVGINADRCLETEDTSGQRAGVLLLRCFNT